MTALIERVYDACRVEGLRPPDRPTVQRRVDELDQQKTARRRGEGDVLAKATPSPGTYTAKVFSTLNELSIEAWRPAVDKEAAFS